jgi:hypothetical protein
MLDYRQLNSCGGSFTAISNPQSAFTERASHLWHKRRASDCEKAHDLQMSYWAWYKEVNQFYYEYNKVMAEAGPAAGAEYV